MRFFSRKRNEDADPLLTRLVERIITDNTGGTDTKGHCTDKLGEAVGVACAYARGMIDELGPPLVLGPHQGVGRALGPILFDTREDAVNALRGAAKVRDVFADPHAHECFFLLTMHRREYVVFGNEIQGELVRRDVMQEAVEFKDQHFSAAAPTLGELRDKLTENVVLYLADLAPERMRRDDAMRTELHHSEELLKAQMQTLDLALRESRPFAAPGSLQAKLSQGSREMGDLLDRLTALSEKPDPEKCLREIRDILNVPQNHIHLEAVEMRVGDFGVKSGTGKLVRFHECCFGDGERLAVFLGSMDRDSAVYLWPELGS